MHHLFLKIIINFDPNKFNIEPIKISPKNRLQFLIILIFNNFLAIVYAQNLSKNNGVKDTISKPDTISVNVKEQLNAMVKTKADSTRYDIPKRMTFLNGSAEVEYEDMKINADYISIDWNTGNVFARGKLNNANKIIEPAKATQAGETYEYDSFNFNYKTKKALAYNAKTEEDEGVIVADKTKKVNDSVFFMRRGFYTTDTYYIKNKDSLADYFLSAPHLKLIKTKKNTQVYTGPIQMYIENVPTPLFLPFAILPITEKRSAGLIPPSFGERQEVGFYLNGLGYYLPIGEHFDLKLLMDLYTKGSWNFRPEVNYRKIYKYSGGFSAEIGANIRGIKGLSDYSKSNTYSFNWRHTQDAKANPFFNFSSSVQLVSSKFYDNTINNNYSFNQNVLNAQQNSSISATKRFLTLPITINGSASYSQNFSTGLGNLRLPQLTVTVNQFFLFKPKSNIRQGLIENININTGLSFTNYVDLLQSEMFTKTMWSKMQTGLKNNISIGTNATLAKYFTFSLSGNIDNVLTNKTLFKNYNPIANQVQSNYNKRVAGFSTFSTSASLQTILYGMLKFNKNSSIQAIRHMFTPSVSFNYSPDFGNPKWGYFKNYYNQYGELTPYSIFDGGVYGSPSSGLVKAIGFSLNNNLEMKVRSKKDSTGVKKIKIFESLSITGGYNFAAKDYKWSYININGQSSFFNNKLNINGSLNLDPYKIIYNPISGIGTRTTKSGDISVQGFNIQMSLPLNNEFFVKKDPDKDKKYKYKGAIRNEVYMFDDDYYAEFSQPWTLNLNANYAYSNNLTRVGTKVASLGLNGSIKLTPYWNLNGSTNYDFISQKLAYTRLGFSRDQRSFTINFNWVPFGKYKVYDFFIGIKANILKDAVKYKDRSFTQPNSPF